MAGLSKTNFRTFGTEYGAVIAGLSAHVGKDARLSVAASKTLALIYRQKGAVGDIRHSSIRPRVQFPGPATAKTKLTEHQSHRVVLFER